MFVNPQVITKLQQRAAVHNDLYGCSRGRSLFVVGVVVLSYWLLCRVNRPPQYPKY